MKWLISGNRARLVLAIGLSLLSFIFAGALMFTSGYMISLAATIPLTALALHLPSIFVRIFGIGKPPIQYAYRLASHDWVLRMTSRLRLCLYDALRKKSAMSHPDKTKGDILAVLTDDIGHAQDMILRGVFPLALAWLLAFAVVALCGFLSPTLAICMALLLVVSCLVAPMVAASANSCILREIKGRGDAIYDDLADNMSGISDWSISCRREDFIQTQMSGLRKKAKLERRVRSRRRVCTLISQLIFCLCVIALVVWASLAFAPAMRDLAMARSISASGAFAEWIGGLTPINSYPYAANWIAAFALCFFPLIEAFIQVEESLETIEQRRGSVDALIDYMGNSANVKPGELDEMARSGRMSGMKAPDANASNGALMHDFPFNENEYLKPDIDISDMSFSYEGKDLFEHFDLHIPFGEKVAITGESGIGKTTLAALMHGNLAPSLGHVRVAGHNATDISARMFELIGMVGQFPHLFDMSLRDNLLMADPTSTDARLEESMRLVGLEELLNSLPDGLDTAVSENGARFSGGERQRIAIARIFLANAPIVLLDEPFAGIDANAERALLDVLMDVFADRTVIVITHHEAGLDRFDRVIRL